MPPALCQTYQDRCNVWVVDRFDRSRSNPLVLHQARYRRIYSLTCRLLDGIVAPPSDAVEVKECDGGGGFGRRREYALVAQATNGPLSKGEMEFGTGQCEGGRLAGFTGLYG